MNWQEADTELTRKVKKYRFEHPHTNYSDAVDIILDDNPELAAAYSSVDSPRTSNIKRQFELDRKIKENPDSPSADIDQYQYRVTAAQFMGWRSASKTYGVDVEREIIEKIQREIMDLESKQILYQKTIENYPEEEKRQRKIIESLQAKLGSSVGHTPTLKEIRAAQDKLLALSGELADAEEDLPRIEAELNALRKKLEKIESGKKFCQQKRYENPSAELADRAKKYSREYDVDYEAAAVRILEDDLVLSTAYNFYDVDKLLGLRG
jgi:hypothetical protein